MTGVRILRLSELAERDVQALLDRSDATDPRVVGPCRGIIDAVRRDGDNAIVRLSKEIDGVELNAGTLRISDDQIDAASQAVEPQVADALRHAITNIRRLHETQVPRTAPFVEVEPGVWCGERWTPINSVCLYVPRGRGSFSSVAAMLAVPATLAGVPRIVLSAPPGPDGLVDPATLAVCRILGITEVYRIGGAQAVAAAAFGTASLARCDKFIGPGNVYVTAARRLVADVIDTGPPAGPSESLIICDDAADPQNVALNLLVEAEHGENSTAILVTHDSAMAERVATCVDALRKLLTPQRRGYVGTVLTQRGGIVLTESMNDSIAFANWMAAEHVALMVRDPWSILSEITNAGEILLGAFPIISLGNYVMGINAILPTGGRASTCSGVGVRDFMKRTALGHVTETGFEALKNTVSALSRNEGFSAHHLAVERWATSGTAVENVL